MTCDQSIELLPWLLNGTLDEGEREEVRKHLVTCERCRQALAETRQAWTVFAQHIPTQDLVAMAWGNLPSELSAAAAEEHLASCAQCAAELEMTRMSRRLEEEGSNLALFPVTKPRPVAGASPRSWRAATLAAGLAAVVAAGGWFNAVRQGGGGNQLAQMRMPAAVDSFDMGAGGVVRSDTREFPNDRDSLLILTTKASGNLEAEILDGTGKVTRKILLSPSPISGVHMVLLPAGMEPGDYTVRLQKDGSSDGSWTFRVVKPAAPS